ncbi:MAG: hypothetical protein AAGA37_05535 [Actinomycetota bacterium]
MAESSLAMPGEPFDKGQDPLARHVHLSLSLALANNPKRPFSHVKICNAHPHQLTDPKAGGQHQYNGDQGDQFERVLGLRLTRPGMLDAR